MAQQKLMSAVCQRSDSHEKIAEATTVIDRVNRMIPEGLSRSSCEALACGATLADDAGAVILSKLPRAGEIDPNAGILLGPVMDRYEGSTGERNFFG
jgi:hypothetical protein